MFEYKLGNEIKRGETPPEILAGWDECDIDLLDQAWPGASRLFRDPFLRAVEHCQAACDLVPEDRGRNDEALDRLGAITISLLPYYYEKVCVSHEQAQAFLKLFGNAVAEGIRKQNTAIKQFDEGEYIVYRYFIWRFCTGDIADIRGQAANVVNTMYRTLLADPWMDFREQLSPEKESWISSLGKFGGDVIDGIGKGVEWGIDVAPKVVDWAVEKVKDTPEAAAVVVRELTVAAGIAPPSPPAWEEHCVFDPSVPYGRRIVRDFVGNESALAWLGRTVITGLVRYDRFLNTTVGLGKGLRVGVMAASVGVAVGGTAYLVVAAGHAVAKILGYIAIRPVVPASKYAAPAGAHWLMKYFGMGPSAAGKTSLALEAQLKIAGTCGIHRGLEYAPAYVARVGAMTKFVRVAVPIAKVVGSTGMILGGMGMALFGIEEAIQSQGSGVYATEQLGRGANAQNIANARKCLDNQEWLISRKNRALIPAAGPAMAFWDYLTVMPDTISAHRAAIDALEDRLKKKQAKDAWVQPDLPEAKWSPNVDWVKIAMPWRIPWEFSVPIPRVTIAEGVRKAVQKNDPMTYSDRRARWLQEHVTELSEIYTSLRHLRIDVTLKAGKRMRLKAPDELYLPAWSKVGAIPLLRGSITREHKAINKLADLALTKGNITDAQRDEIRKLNVENPIEKKLKRSTKTQRVKSERTSAIKRKVPQPFDAVVDTVLDGDTIRVRELVTREVGYEQTEQSLGEVTLKIRISGMDAPEPETAAGQRSKDFLSNVFNTESEFYDGKPIVRVVPTRAYDKYGRLAAKIYLTGFEGKPEVAGDTATRRMIKAAMAKPGKL